MTNCTHQQWIDITQEDRQLSISYGMRLRHLVAELRDPGNQYPSVIFFYGKSAKVLALRSLFCNNNITRRRAHGIGNLHIDITTAATDYPLLFVDCKLGAAFVNQLGGWTGCHELTQLRVEWEEEIAHDPLRLSERIRSRLLFSFTDVICIFSDDLGGVVQTENLLLTWSQSGYLESSSAFKPHVIVVYETMDLPEAKRRKLQRAPEIVCHFASLSFVHLLPMKCLSREAAHDNLKKAMLHAADDSRRSRVAGSLLFSAKHLASLFETAFTHFATFSDQPLSIIKATRKDHNTENLVLHLGRFLDACSQNDLPGSVTISFVACALTLDSYAPGMHRKFKLFFLE
jgi:hypothetical protein